jgi:uncharacterized protein (TIGR03382 family)
MRLPLLASLVPVFIASLADAGFVATYDIGVGASASFVQFEFADGDAYLYTVRWDGTVTGRDLFSIIAAAQPDLFGYETVVFPFGEALLGVTIGDSFDAGFGTPPLFLDYWHYWTKATTIAPWDASLIGFSERVVTDGAWDGWVFGSDAPPQPIPAPAAAALLVLAAGRGGRRRRR